MIYGVVIVTGTGTLLFEKTWTQLPAHSRVFESKVYSPLYIYINMTFTLTHKHFINK